MNTEVFRFMTIRPAQRLNEEEKHKKAIVVPGTSNTSLNKKISERLSGDGIPSTTSNHLTNVDVGNSNRLKAQLIAHEVASEFLQNEENALSNNPLWTKLNKYRNDLLLSSNLTDENLKSIQQQDSILQELHLEFTADPNVTADFFSNVYDHFKANILSGRIVNQPRLINVIKFGHYFVGNHDKLHVFFRKPILIETISGYPFVKFRPPGGIDFQLGTMSSIEFLSESTVDIEEVNWQEYRKPHFGPIGFGDLRMVTQNLLKYVPGEISYIENVLKSEFRERNYRSLDKTEELVESIEEINSDTEENLKSAERYELQSTSSEIINNNTSLEVGGSLKVTSRYGVTVEAAASANYSTSTAKSSAKEISSQFARDTIRESVKRIQEKVTSRERKIIIKEQEQNYLHRFDNVQGQEHVIGHYRFLDKVYENQLINYGKRLLFEFIIPEPAKWIKINSANSTQKLKKPTLPPFSENDLTIDDYLDLIHSYEPVQKSGIAIPTPPDKNIVVSHSGGNASPSNEDTSRFVESGFIDIPEGYQAESAVITIHFTPPVPMNAYIDSTKNYRVDTSVGGIAEKLVEASDNEDKARLSIVQQQKLPHAAYAVGSESTQYLIPERPTDTKTINLNREIKKVPFFVQAVMHSAIAYTIEIKAALSARSEAEWKQSAYSKVMEAYRSTVSEYSDWEQTQQFIDHESDGPNPKILRSIEKEELKRRCIEYFEPSEWGAGSYPIDEGWPVLDEDQIEKTAPFIRFFETGFEWEQMTYQFYPYFWAAKDEWSKMALLQHKDTLHSSFLKAGAARVIIPVRPGFEKAVHYFLWSGGIVPKELEEPLFTDETFLSIAEEISSKNTQEEVIEDCWNSIVPTNLVTLDGQNEIKLNDPSEVCQELRNVNDEIDQPNES